MNFNSWRSPLFLTLTSLLLFTPHLGNAQQSMEGLAAWYGPGFVGNRTANGEIFNPNELTAAHRSLPFNTQLRVTHITNRKSVIVRINDRLGDPTVIIDLSMGAAKVIGLSGKARVRLEILKQSP